MSDLWDKTNQLAKDAGVAASNAGKAVADSTTKLTDQAGAAAGAAWESTKEAGKAAADEAAKLTDSATSRGRERCGRGYQSGNDEDRRGREEGPCLVWYGPEADAGA